MYRFCNLFKSTVIIIILSLLYIHNAYAQNYVFARLTGSPVMNTTGWNLVGDAKIGHTAGETGSNNDEMILCHASTWLSGACIFNTPINLSICTKWAAEFDYRIYDGTAADGIAFCFLANPPTSYINGGGVGIPTKPVGIMVVLDQFYNCGNNANPKLEIRYGDGTADYTECPTTAMPTLYSQSILRQTNYNHMKIVYDKGNIDVYINNQFMLSGYYQANYKGYLGFTSSTGAQTDNHSIRNVVIYTSFPIASAGGNKTICSGDTITIGSAARTNYSYLWSPSDHLDNPAKSNPELTLTNLTDAPVNYKYVLTVDSAGIGCKSSDSLFVTVKPKPHVNIGKDTTLCTGESISLNASFPNSQYLWQDGSTNSEFNVSSPGTYNVTVTNDCASLTDTVKVDYATNVKIKVGTDSSLCEQGVIKLSASNGYKSYLWQDGSSLPYFFAKTFGTYYVDAIDKYNCTSRDQAEFADTCSYKITIPDIFTPNKDAKNDKYYCRGTYIKSFDISVYNRWGIELYKSNDINEGWDGKFKGSEVPSGVYFCLINYTALSKGNLISKSYNGTITLVR